MADPVLQPTEGRHQVAFHDLHVVEIVLQGEVVRADLVHELDRLRGAVEVEAGDVAGVDRLDHQPDPGLGELGCCVAQIVDEGLADLGRGRVLGRDAGKAVDPLAAQGGRILDGADDAGAELLLAARQAADAPLAAGPVAGRHVVQGLGQAVLLEQVGQELLLVGVGEQILDRLEAVGRGRGEALDEVVLVVEHGQIGRELRHVVLPPAARPCLTPAV